MSRITPVGSADSDMLVIRGANVYPSAVEAVVGETPGTGSEFRIVVQRPHDLDETTVQVERAADLPPEQSNAVVDELESRLRLAVHLRVPVVMLEPNSLEEQTFKARRVLDQRSDTSVPAAQPSAR